MSFDEIDLPEEEINEGNEEQALEMSEDATPSGRFERLFGENSRKYKLSNMFREWYIDYSS